ncbi:hypothetical protein [Prosthecobacter dejongeii]|uniref:Uncharacterized protein n=1 Tax=Prosthecobacter dejongeii TaxID=48465 RepID=A0A7W8DQK6_9BACT|nr:hypothetical protein [Prosthecobacter dejongeii]MBB5038285.1 hypothetical protein [Prosthecobacter dejongeii]
MKTAQNAPEELLNELVILGFAPGRWDSKDCRILDLKNDEGHTALRVTLDYDGEPKPQTTSLLKLDGRNSQSVEWSSQNMSASMPLPGLLALIKACL